MYHSGGDVDNGGGCAFVGVGSIREISVLSAQFFCEPTTALQNEAPPPFFKWIEESKVLDREVGIRLE